MTISGADFPVGIIGMWCHFSSFFRAFRREENSSSEVIFDCRFARILLHHHSHCCAVLSFVLDGGYVFFLFLVLMFVICLCFFFPGSF